MLNNNCKYNIFPLLLILLFTSQITGVTYKIDSFNSNSAEISFSLSKNDIPSAVSKDIRLIFAVTSNPSVSITCNISSLNGISCKNNAQPLSNGIMGKDFLQWFSATVGIDKKYSSNLKEIGGTFSLKFNRPILKSGLSPDNFPVRNCIIRLPVINVIRKTISVKKPYIPFTSGLRMEVSKDGIYRLTGKDLKKLGISIESIPSKSFRLFCKDSEIPIFITNSFRKYMEIDDEIFFYGHFLRGKKHYYTQYSFINIYWLTWDSYFAGTRVAEATGAQKIDPLAYSPDMENLPPLLASEYRDTLHIEEDNDIRWQGDIFNIEETEHTPLSDEDIDNWYWHFVGDEELTHFTFLLPSPQRTNNRNVRMKILLTGLTSINSIPNDHQYSISLNNKETGSIAVWDGQNDYELVSDLLPANHLVHGENTLTFIRLQSDTIPDRAALNWIEIEYTRGYKSLGNKINFRNNPDYMNRVSQFDLTGFTTDDLELWDIANYRKFDDFKIIFENNNYTLSFQDSITMQSHYFAQAKSLRLTPLSMVLDTITDNWDFPDGVDYLVISGDTFITILQPLIDVHRESGLKVETIDIQDIYNRFSYGIHDPESIRSMLKYVFYMHPDNPPRYLLLGGDASHDMDKKDRYKNIIPTHLSRVPNWGPASDDAYFATVMGEDNFPDLYVGRFPARNPDDMNILVEKTVNYLLYPERSYWRDNLILAGGFEHDFTIFNDEAVKTVIGPRMNVLRMDADPYSQYYRSGSVAANTMADYINAGVYAINFIGHGGGNIWSDSKFFSYTDLYKLHNSQWGKSGRLPIIFSFTCLTGFFESVFYESLGEEFLRQSPDGAICFYGASAYTRMNIDIQMDRVLLTNAMNYEFESIGELLSITEMLMLASNASEALPLVRQYNLLGDPAIPWKLAPDSLEVSIENPNLKGTDTLKVTGNTSPVISGNVKLTVSAEHGINWKDIIKDVADSTFNHNFVLKPTSQTANGLVRAFAWDDSSEIVGWALFSKDTFAISDVSINPSTPALGDSIDITCRMNSRDSLYEPIIQCRYTIDYPWEKDFVFDDNSYVIMQKDIESDLWKSTTAIPIGSSEAPFDINKSLVLKFFATGVLQTSDFYYFKLKGRSDLTFTSDTFNCRWNNDSLYVKCEVLNKGNSPAPVFSVMFEGYGTDLQDTIFHGYSLDSLFPGKIASFNFSIPDTQGTLFYTGSVNINRDIEEVLYSNNTTDLIARLTYADIKTASDTLFSQGKGCCLVPSDTLSSSYRIFLFPDTLKDLKPLMSESEWIPLYGDGLSCFSIYTRPPLASRDSLNWIFLPEQINAFINVSSDSGFRPGIFLFDSLSSQWINRGGTLDTSKNTIHLFTNETGPYTTGMFVDNTPPEIKVFVAGKEILFIDYAAKEKPFNIFINDSSGISPSSIVLLLNGSPLDKNYRSSLITGENPTNAILTAYPQKINRIDSLTVIAEDNAGNRAEKVFCYMPGEKLSIKFFSCHPNPFSGKKGKLVRFAYLLSDVAKNVTLTIYTISGRKVWQWKSTTELIGYQEIAWDCTTQNRRVENVGYRIANGTYYAKLVARNSRKKAEKIIRIAKLEGY